ncbi:Lrp/AsnC family transcriptional regulator [Gorillibacterium timonense]|uniref:Lrp/AsnC family transcriptional regulator n=1 Tax=Gorillibacterium timonense TaxID=1689269 RepID=UPI00071E1E47|nr:Lrp/AsnC family transcriptional regulator [Gorillibacterium timonense]
MDVSIDRSDLLILQCLAENATLTHKEIGSRVHLSGQAVGLRVRKLEDAGIIEGYSARLSAPLLGLGMEGFVLIFLKSPMEHERFQDFIQKAEPVEEAHRISGDGCYWLRVRMPGLPELDAFLDEVLQYGNYKLYLSVKRLKSVGVDPLRALPPQL